MYTFVGKVYYECVIHSSINIPSTYKYKFQYLSSEF